MTLRLDMGGGDFPAPGFLNVDPYCPTADISAEMWAVPLGDGTVDEIRSCHSMEHISKYQVVPTLLEWKRVLAPDGVITIEVPDLVWVCQNWLWRRSNDWHMDTIFGQQNRPGEEHRTGFTKEIMESYLDAAGLRLTNYAVVQSHGQDTLHFEVSK